VGKDRHDVKHDRRTGAPSARDHGAGAA
jgi:hypothetical protein